MARRVASKGSRLAQNGILKPGGSTVAMRACEAASTLFTASFTAAATRSSSISRSSDAAWGSICTRFTSCLPFIVTLTMPPPDSPITSIEAISSCAFLRLACICMACFIMFPPPRIEVSFLLFRGPHRLRVQRRAESRLHLAHRGIFLERALRGIEGFRRAALDVLRRGLRYFGALDEFDLHV